MQVDGLTSTHCGKYKRLGDKLADHVASWDKLEPTLLLLRISNTCEHHTFTMEDKYQSFSTN